MGNTELIIEDETTIVEKTTIVDHLLGDETLAEGLNEIALGATKTITSKDEGSWEVPDYNSRLKALDMQLRMKGHFKDKNTGNELPKGIYIFKKT